MTQSASNETSLVQSRIRTSNVLKIVSLCFIVIGFVGMFINGEWQNGKIIELKKALLQCQTDTKRLDTTTSIINNDKVETKEVVTTPDQTITQIDTSNKKKSLDTTIIPVKMIGQWKVCFDVSSIKNFSCSKPRFLYQFLSDGSCRIYTLGLKAPSDSSIKAIEWKIFADGNWTMNKNELLTRAREYTEGSTFINNLELYFISPNDYNKFYSQEGKGKKIVYTVIERVQPDYVVNSIPDTGFRNRKVSETTAPNTSTGFPISINTGGQTTTATANGKFVTVSPNGKPTMAIPSNITAKKDSIADTLRVIKDSAKKE